MTWLPSVSGRAIDLVRPVADQVLFPEIAWSLAHLNRYGGHPQVPVSCALHTLIGFDLAPERLRPWWLIHEAHKTRTGELPRPTVEALEEIADGSSISGARQVLDFLRADLRRRHELVIHDAAGLPVPNPDQRAAIAELDRRCEATEQRDFHSASERPWSHELAGVKPSPRRASFLKPDRAADQLAGRFRDYLPALRAAAA